MENTNVSLGEILRAAMDDKGLGIRRLESLSGVNRRTIQRVLKDKVDVRANALKMIIEALDRA